VIADLRRLGSAKVRAGMARYAIPSAKAFGVPVGAIRKLAKSLGKSHELAAALWESGWHEARTLAARVDETERVTLAQMNRRRGDLDNWAICDTVCFHLFDRTPHTLGRVRAWSRLKGECDRRAAFALLASLAAPDRALEDTELADCLPLIERTPDDDRNFVKQGLGRRCAWSAAPVAASTRPRSPSRGASRNPTARRPAGSDGTRCAI
jgi:3-methyladenine DNA glycosylase AlkD